MKDSICAEVELNKLSLIRPTLLLRYDKMIIDKYDYDEMRSREDSGWRSLIKNNLLFLEDIGAIEVVDFKGNLGEYSKHSIKKVGETITSQLTTKEKKRLLLATWKDFIQYLEIKAFHTQANRAEYMDLRKKLTKLKIMYEDIKLTSWNIQFQDRILEKCFWKTLASSNISTQVSNSMLHLANEYSPFIDYVKPVEGQERISQIDQLVKHVYSLALPNIEINNYNEQMVFIELRKKKLDEYMLLCGQLEEMLLSYDDNDPSLINVKNFLSDRWSYGYSSFHNYYKKLETFSNISGEMIDVIVKTFQYFFPSIPNVPIPKKLIQEKTKDALVRPFGGLKNSTENWQVSFSNLINESEIKRIRKHIHLERKSEKVNSSKTPWEESIDELPWYATSKYD